MGAAEKMVFRGDTGAPDVEYLERAAPLVVATLDEKTRSIEAIGATEQPSLVYDPNRGEVVKEVLLMSGCQIPENGKIPLTIEHYRSAVDVIGSFGDMQVSGDELRGRAYFASSSDAEPYYIKVREKHLDSLSVAYRADDRVSVWVPEGRTEVIEGKAFTGPVLITTKWIPRSMGLVLYGADSRAKTRGAAQEKSFDGGNEMNKLREILIKRGMKPDATDDEMAAFLAALPDAEMVRAEVAKIENDLKAQAERERAAAIETERKRVDEIMSLCSRFEMPDDVARGMISAGKTLEQAKLEVAEKVLARTARGVSHRGTVEGGADEVDKFRAAAVDGLLIRCGNQPQTVAVGADELAGFTLRELARKALALRNERCPNNPMEMVGRALVASDLPYVLGAAANKSLFAGYETAEETWSQWCAVGSVNDFNTHRSARLSESSDLDEIPESQPYKYGELSDAQETYSIATYGKMFAISRQAIINDDLSALSDIPKRHGEAAARKVGDVAYAVLTGNAAMGDSKALFHSDHDNYVASGSGAAPGIATIAAGILAMGTQKDLASKRRLNIRPVFFIGPKALEGVTEVFFRSERFSDANTIATDSSMASTRVNPYAGNYFTRIYDARLDDDDPAAWYLAAAKGKTVTVFFLGGNQKPFLEERQGWTVDGVEYKVRIDCGAKALDWRGLYYNDGN